MALPPKINPPSHLLAADPTVLLDPVEGVVHQTTVAPHVVGIAVYQFLMHARQFEIYNAHINDNRAQNVSIWGTSANEDRTVPKNAPLG